MQAKGFCMFTFLRGCCGQHAREPGFLGTGIEIYGISDALEPFQFLVDIVTNCC